MNQGKKTIISFFILIVVMLLFVFTATSFLSSNLKKKHYNISGNIYNGMIIVDVPTCPSKTYSGQQQILMDDTEAYILDRAKRKATPAGTYNVELILNDGYIWSDYTTENKIIQCTINPYNINNAIVSRVHNQKYTGAKIEPSVSISTINNNLTKDTDYDISYSNNKNIGTATIRFNGKGNYTGTKDVTFKIKESLNSDDLTFKVGTFNIGGWKCGNKTGGITCPDSTNDKISAFLNNLNIDLIGIQEGAVFDDDNNTLTTNINELASLTNSNLRYVAPKHINALLSKYTIKNDSNIPLTDCAYDTTHYMEKRALLKEVININGIDISVYVVHIGYGNCNEIHFEDIASAISNDNNPTIIMGDFNTIPTDRLDTYIKPLGYVSAGHDTNYKNTGTDNYMDSILVKGNGLIDVVSSETYDTYDIYTDHNLVVSTLRIKDINIPDLVDNEYLLTDNNTTVSEIKTKYSSYSINVYDLNNNIVSDTSKVRSNYKIKFNDTEYKVALKGDFNMDGYVDDGDVYNLYIYTYNELFGIPNPEKSNIEMKAGDYNKDGHIDDGDVYDLYIYTFHEIFG